jgi:hypothetical protein
MTAYICGASGQPVEGHNPDECVPCLRRMRDYWKQEAGSDLHARLRDMDRRIREQRRELARLNEQAGADSRLITRLAAEKTELKRAVETAFLAAVHDGAACPFCQARTETYWPYCVHFKEACVISRFFVTEGLEDTLERLYPVPK